MTDTRKYIEEQFDQFFEFETSDRSNVTSASCRFFAEHCIEQLLAVIAKKDEALSAVDDLIEHQYCGSKDAMTDLQIACDMTHEALALQPADVELVEIGEARIIDINGTGTFVWKKGNMPALAENPKLYTIKTKGK